MDTWAPPTSRGVLNNSHDCPPPLPLHSSPSASPPPPPFPFSSSVLLIGRSRSHGDRKQHARRRFSVLKQKTKKPHPSPPPPSSLPSHNSLCFTSKMQHLTVYTPQGDADIEHTPEMDLKRWPTASGGRGGGREGGTQVWVVSECCSGDSENATTLMMMMMPTLFSFLFLFCIHGERTCIKTGGQKDTPPSLSPPFSGSKLQTHTAFAQDLCAGRLRLVTTRRSLRPAVPQEVVPP